MKKHGKKYNAAAEKIEVGRKYNLDEAVAKVKEIAFAKFDETVELTMWLGVDPAGARNYRSAARARQIEDGASDRAGR
jgi:large subunit ribosomal protein L1